MTEKKYKLKNMVEISMIAALYVALTFFSATIGIAYSGIQFRVSEVLTILPILTSNAIPGLAIGCFISNLSSPFGLIDVIFGTLSTIITAVLTRKLRKIKVKDIPILSFMPPVLLGAISVGLIVSIFNLGKFYWPIFLPVFLNVFLSQFIICYGLGIPFFMILKKQEFYKRGG